ncbi:PP2C family protein-serine/threonine phosphatase [Streptomyces sp. NPDC090080]|uniref:PP2C family protein-serine/threonine phosphatase n=1 Tax=Streptomyces sp. NPDC090080 TaxID=3365939 RepID=UPI0037F1D72C
MNVTDVDYRAVFQVLPGPAALLTTDLVYVDVNEALLALAGLTRDHIIGRYLFDVFPQNPDAPDATGMRNLAASLHRVTATAESDIMALQRYDVRQFGRQGVWQERYWSTVNAPVLAPDNSVALLLNRIEEVTEIVKADHKLIDGKRAQILRAELSSRARELQQVNRRLRTAHAREHEVALHLQKAMLPEPRHLSHHDVAVRYRPSVGALSVCGDWYDLVELPGGDRMAVCVGDVVGHGLHAAGVMGQLRSALSAASHVADSPAEALDALGLYARSVEGAESTTAASVFVDRLHRTLAYSSAGHPPPALCRPDGSVVFLDEATDPPLGARIEHVPPPVAHMSYSDGCVLVLYTDGLVERRGEDIDAGLTRLATSLTKHHSLGPDSLADVLLADLVPPRGLTDDTVLVIVRL